MPSRGPGVDLSVPLPEELAERLRFRLASNSVRRENGCLEWTGGVDGYGRPQMSVRNWPEKCPRVSYAVHVGPIDADLVIAHECDNPRCLEPSHLAMTEQTWNMVDMYAKGRDRWTRTRGRPMQSFG